MEEELSEEVFKGQTQPLVVCAKVETVWHAQEGKEVEVAVENPMWSINIHVSYALRTEEQFILEKLPGTSKHEEGSTPETMTREKKKPS